jgi:eukaryotic-like serine/threonine-protein kinase
MRLPLATIPPYAVSQLSMAHAQTLPMHSDIDLDFDSDTQELPTWELPSFAMEWERERISRHLSGHFQIVRELGRGGMGVVFLARDIALHRLVAIKVLRHEFATCEEHRERFRREARMTARLSHPNIVPVHTFGEQDDLVYIVMKYVHGESLGDRMRRLGALDPDNVQSILADLARALESAHRAGVVHRDLKPENILIEHETGRPMLTDFGVALLRSLDPVRSDVARAFGTPHYMSPEQAAGELDIDGRSDVYSVGVLGYYMLSGELPYDGPSFESLAAKHIAGDHVPLAELVPGAPTALVNAIECCLRKDRADRWRFARDLAVTLEKRPRRRWLRATAAFNTSLVRTRMLAELTLFGAAMKAALFRWTTI